MSLTGTLTKSLTRTLTHTFKGWLTGENPILNWDFHSWWTSADLNGDYQTIDNGGTSSAGQATLGSTSGADSNDPTYLDWQGDPAADNDIVPDYVDDNGEAWYFAGPNLMENGDFSSWTGDNPDNWTVENGPEDANNYFTEVSGALRLVTDGTSIGLKQANVFTAGKTYYVGLNVLANPDPGWRFGDTVGGGIYGNISFTGTKGEIFTPTYTNLMFYRHGGTADLTVDDIVVREVFRGSRKGYRYVGPELVTNGGFDTDLSGWSAVSNATLTWNAGELEIDITGSGGGADATTITSVAGNWYMVTFDMRQGTYAGDMAIIIDGVALNDAQLSSTTSSHTYLVNASDTSFSFRTQRADALTGTVYVDNVSVREVTPYGNPEYVYLDGSLNTNIEQASEDGNSITGSFTAETEIAVDNWDSGVIKAIMGKWNYSTNQRGWLLTRINDDFTLYLSDDGTNLASATASTHGLIDGEKTWVRVEYDVSTTTGKVWVSPDYVTWTQVGSDLTSFSYTSLHASTASLMLGAHSGGASDRLPAKFYNYRLYSGVGSDKVLVSSWSAADMGTAGGPDSNKSNWDVQDSGTYYAYASDNLVTNGTFTTDTDWIKAAGWSITGGKAVGDPIANQLSQTVSNFWAYYYLTLDVDDVTNDGFSAKMSGGSHVGQIATTGSKTYVLTAAGNALQFINWSGTSTCIIDNVVLRGIAPVSQGDWTLNGGYSVAAPSSDYVYLPGSASNYISSTNPDLTGDQTWTIWCAADDWASGANQSLMGVQYWAGSDSSWNMQLRSAGEIRVTTYDDGVTAAVDTTSAISAIDGEWFGIQGRFDLSAGTCEILTSTDGQNWTSFDTLTGLDTTLYSATTDLEIGSANQGLGNLFAGKIGWATIHDNATYTGDPVWEFRADQSTQSGYSDPYSGEANTINRSSSGLKSTLVTRPTLLLNSAASTYLEVADHDDIDMGADDDFTVWFYGREHDVQAGDSALVSKDISLTTSAFAGYNLVKRASTTSRLWIHDGTNQANDSLVDAPYQTAKLSAGTRKATEGIIEVFINGIGSGGTSETLGSLSTAKDLSVGADNGGAGGNNPDFEVWAWGVVKGTALTSQQLSQLKNEIDSRLGGRTGE